MFFSQSRFLVGRRGDRLGMTGWGCAAEQEQRCGLGIERVNMYLHPLLSAGLTGRYRTSVFEVRGL